MTPAPLRVYVRIPAFTIDQSILAGEDVRPTLPEMNIGELTRTVRRLEGLGVNGVLLADHLFVSHGGPRVDSPTPPEPMTVLSAVGALSSTLTMGTIVMNLGINEPAMVFRQFGQLAELYGGDRVLAGVGAGWNPEEFDAIGRTMPSYKDRIGRLGEGLRLGRELYDNGFANFTGDYLVARDLPAAPRLSNPPRIMVGGGSDALLDLAGRYADALDVNGSSKRAKLGGAQPHNIDTQRRLTTTLEDLEESVSRVSRVAVDSGRPADAVSFSTYLNMVNFGSPSEVEVWERGLCDEASLDYRPLADCPYVLAGDPRDVAERLAERRARLGLDAIMVNAGPELEVLCNEVLPLLP